MSCIYNISFKDCDDFYVGSSIDLRFRKYYHKSKCYNKNSKEYTYKLYQFIRDNYEWESVIFEVLEQHDEILDKLELRKREQHFIDDLHPTLNCVRAYRTDEELKEQNRITLKKYYQNNKEKIIKNVKKYVEENREEVLKKQREKYHKNKHNLIQHKCECGGTYIAHKARHFKTKQHQDYLANLNKEN